MTFQYLLNRVGLKKKDLARNLGMNPNSVTNWKDKPPQYAVAYLKLLAKYNDLKEQTND